MKQKLVGTFKIDIIGYENEMISPIDYTDIYPRLTDTYVTRSQGYIAARMFAADILLDILQDQLTGHRVIEISQNVEETDHLSIKISYATKDSNKSVLIICRDIENE